MSTLPFPNEPTPMPDPVAAAHDPALFDAAMAAFAAQNPRLPIAVAFSGGADSTALLLACAERWPQQVEAWHVHHGLQAAADEFERHCIAVCNRLNVPLQVRRVDARHSSGDSPEDVARRHRYACFDALALEHPAQEAIKTVVIAQHADDQVETVLLALSRGAGLPGLAAMPARWQRGVVDYWRPLLDVPAPAVRAWLRARGQPWVEDPSNQNLRYTRNRIRAQLLPDLEAVFPQFRTTFGRSAVHAAQAQHILAEVAADDLHRCGEPPQISVLQTATVARQANLLRHWLLTQHRQTPSSAQLAALQVQIAACTTRGHRIQLKVGNGWVVRQGDAIAWVAALSDASATG